jgi:hypothetical protein
MRHRLLPPSIKTGTQAKPTMAMSNKAKTCDSLTASPPQSNLESRNLVGRFRDIPDTVFPRQAHT